MPTLLEGLKSPHWVVRSHAAFGLHLMGPPAILAVPTLSVVRDTDPDICVRLSAERAIQFVAGGPPPSLDRIIELLNSGDPRRRWAVHLLEQRGADAAPAVPHLLAAKGELNVEYALQVIGKRLKLAGGARPAVALRAYWSELLGLLAVLTFWFALAARYPARRPASKLKQAPLFLLVAIPPTLLAAWAANTLCSVPWLEGYLPDVPITQLPLPLAALLSAAFCTSLAAVGVFLRKPALRTCNEPPQGAAARAEE